MMWVGCCPCCGGSASVSYGEENIGWNDIWYVVRIKCDDHSGCGLQLEVADRPSSHDDNMRLVDDAIGRWNRRVVPQAYALGHDADSYESGGMKGEG